MNVWTLFRGSWRWCEALSTELAATRLTRALF